MMTKKLARHGNSRALVIEKPILDLLGIEDDTVLEMSTDGKRLIFMPVDTETRREKIRKITRHMATRYDKALRAMAGEEEEK